MAGPAAVDPDNPGSWTLAPWDTTTLDAGQYLVGVRAEDAEGNITWSYLTQAEVDVDHPGDFANPGPSPGVLTDTFTNSCGASVAAVKTVSPAGTTAGQKVLFTVTISNSTTGPVTVTQIDDFLPTGFAFSNTAPEGPEGGSLAASIVTGPADTQTGTLTWTLAGPGTVIAAGGSGDLTFYATVSGTEGTYSNTADVTTDHPVWTTVTTDPVDISVGSPRLTIAKSASSYSLKAGDTVTFTITYSNDSPVNTTGVSITDPLPTGFNFVAASDGGSYDSGTRTVTWNLPDLASLEGPYTVSFNATVDKDASTTSVNIATIASNETAPAQGSTTLFVDSPMQINKTADKTVVYPGQGNPDDQVVYTISYSNIPAPALSRASPSPTPRRPGSSTSATPTTPVSPAPPRRSSVTATATMTGRATPTSRARSSGWRRRLPPEPPAR